MNDATPEVFEIGKIHLEGNVIPHTWYHHIKGPTGRPDVEAIVLLSEILYWYRPEYVRDEHTGQVIGVRKRFKGDALQKSKKALAEQFGFTERKVKESLALLEKIGVITRDYRTVETSDGVLCSNVMYIKIHPEKIKEISFKNVIPMAEFCHTPPTNFVIPPPEKCQTYTDNIEKKKKKKEAALPTLSFDYEKQEFVGITEKDLATWKDLYPGIDIQRELGKMRQWLIDPENPERVGNRTFITNWLNKATPRKSTSKSQAVKQPQEPKSPQSMKAIIPYNSSIAYSILNDDGVEEYIDYLKAVVEKKYYENFEKGIYEEEYRDYLKQQGGAV
jgi:hypothetical protein